MATEDIRDISGGIHSDSEGALDRCIVLSGLKRRSGPLLPTLSIHYIGNTLEVLLSRIQYICMEKVAKVKGAPYKKYCVYFIHTPVCAPGHGSREPIR